MKTVGRLIGNAVPVNLGENWAIHKLSWCHQSPSRLPATGSEVIRRAARSK